MVFYERFLQTERRQLSMKAVVILAAIAVIWFCGVSLWEASDAGLVPEDPAGRRALSSNLARTGITLISTVFACLFLAVPLTANMYTPQLIPSFVRSKTNALMLGFFVLSGATGLWTSRLPMEAAGSAKVFEISLILVISSLVLLLPYLFSVFKFLEPRTIVARMHDAIINAMVSVKHDGKQHDQEVLGERIRQMGNIILRALERSDRDLALNAVEALCSCARRYEHIKADYGDAWFDISRQHFPGFSRAAFEDVLRQRTWVEMEILRQLSRAYTSALARMPDVISAISRSQRRLALEAASKQDAGALSLTIRFFNNFMREAVTRKDIHAVFDLSYQVRVLAGRLWPDHADHVLELVRRQIYYADMAHAQDLPFARDLIALDLGRVVSDVAPDTESHGALLDLWLGLAAGHENGRPVVSVGISRARLMAAARLAESGFEQAAERVASSLADVAPIDWDVVAHELLDDPPQLFWEVTDRQENLFWCAPDERARIASAIEILKEQS